MLESGVCDDDDDDDGKWKENREKDECVNFYVINEIFSPFII